MMNSPAAAKRTSRVAAALLVLSLGGCAEDDGGGSEPGPSSAPTSSKPHSGDATVATAPDPASFGAYSRKSRTFTSEIAAMPFTIEVPGGWTVLERHPQLAQLWQGRNEELSAGELTISLEVPGSAAEVRRAFEEAVDGTPSSPMTPATYGPYSVQEMRVREAPSGLPGGYRLPPTSEATVVIFDVGGRGVTVYLDPFSDVESPPGVARMLRQLGEVLQTIRFTRG